MRVIVLFDLPTSNKKERRDATRFRKCLIDDGFDMLQYSVYSRICPNRDIAEKHLMRVERQSPPLGSVRVMYVTESQFVNMRIVVGNKTVQEERAQYEQVTFF